MKFFKKDNNKIKVENKNVFLEEEFLFTLEKSHINESTKISNTYYISKWRETFVAFFSKKLTIFLFTSLIIFLLLILFLPLFSFYDPYTTDPNNINAGVSFEHLFGTDILGRDFFSRVIGGVRFSLTLAITASIINIFIAIIVGLLSGYYETFDKYFKYIIKILYAFPSLLVLIIFSSIFEPSFLVMLFSLVLTGWVTTSQQIRANTSRLRNSDYITSKILNGFSKPQLFSTLLVFSSTSLLLNSASTFSRMIFAESVLGILGLTIPEVPTIGSLLKDGRINFLNHPMQLLIPLFFLLGIVIIVQLLIYTFEEVLLKPIIKKENYVYR